MPVSSRPLARRQLLRGAAGFSIAIVGLPLLGGCGSQRSTAGYQRSPTTPRIGFLSLGALEPPDPSNTIPAFRDAFRQGLRDLGYVEGKTITVEYRFAEGNAERLQQHTIELVRLPVSVIVAADPAAAESARRATQSIPIVTSFTGDPVATGLVASLARPGGNVTGPADQSIGLSGKRLEILKTAAPAISYVGVFWNTTLADRKLAFQETHDAGPALGVTVRSLGVGSPADFSAAFDVVRTTNIDAFLLLEDALIISGGAGQLALMRERRIPNICEGRGWPAAGGLLSYGVDEADLYRRAAGYVDRILKGAKPADLPVDRPTKFSLVVNLQTARELDLSIPQAVLAQATEVIQ